jgi:hypothetical protein
MAVDDCEHLLIKLIEKFVHHVGEVEFAAQKVSLEFHEKFAENIRVLFVDHAVCLLEHLMETVAGLREKGLEEFWNRKKFKVD